MRARRRRSRDRSKGVAVIELALSMLFLIPLLCAAVDFGYYFYIGSNVEEAARQGAIQAARITGNAACVSGPATIATTTVSLNYPTASGINCLNGGGGPPDSKSAVFCYMNEPPLQMAGSALGPTSVTTMLCDTNPGPGASWHVTVKASFPLLLGFYKPLFPAGSVSGTVGYSATATAN